MSGDNHNQADPLDLDAIEARANMVDEGPGDYDVRDILALVAEVRRLRERVDAAETEGFRLGIGAVVMSIDAASPDEVWRIVNTYREAAEEASS